MPLNLSTTSPKDFSGRPERQDLERPATVSAIVTTVVSTIALIAFLVATQESRTVGLLELIRVVHAAITPVAPMSVAIKVRPLRIIVLTTLSIARTGIQTVLVPLINCDLRDVAVAIVTTIIAIPIRVLAIRPLRVLSLHSSTRRDSNTRHERKCHQDSPDLVSEMM